MTEKLKHTAGPWKWDEDIPRPYRANVACGIRSIRGAHVCDFGYTNEGGESDSGILPFDADIALLLLAPTAPHHCSNPACPGDRNRRLLEAGEKLAEAAKHYRLNNPCDEDTTKRFLAATRTLDAALAEYRAAKENV